jgi:hypothetical protein
MRGVPRDRRAISIAPSDVMPRSSSRAAHHQFQFLDRIELQPHRNAEAVTQRRRQQSLPRRGAHQREARQVDPHRSRRRPLADHQVQRTVLHRWIEHFLDRRIEPVDLVHEQHIALVQISEQRREIARLGDHRARCGAEPNAHFLGDNLRQRRLAKARRAEEQHMVQRVAALPRRLDKHP